MLCGFRAKGYQFTDWCDKLMAWVLGLGHWAWLHEMKSTLIGMVLTAAAILVMTVASDQHESTDVRSNTAMYNRA